MRAGADKISVNSAAVRDPERAARGLRRVRGAVHRDRDRRATSRRLGWEVVVEGGRTPTGIDAVEWARRTTAEHGAGEVLLTSMDRDGTKDGYDIELTRTISEAVTVPVIASGGAGTPEHFAVALTDGKADAALAASVFHFGEMRIADVKAHLRERGDPGAMSDRPAISPSSASTTSGRRTSTGDVDFYVRQARRGERPDGRARRRNRPDRDPDRAGRPRA